MSIREGLSGFPKQKFGPDEDTRLTSLVQLHGPRNWKLVASRMPGRNPRQCRERWKHYLKPSINRGDWTEAEDDLLVSKYRELGPKWSQISAFFVSRTDVDLKNRYQRIRRLINKSVDERQDPPGGQIFPLLLPERAEMTILHPAPPPLTRGGKPEDVKR
jgi:hypothetical protein